MSAVSQVRTAQTEENSALSFNQAAHDCCARGKEYYWGHYGVIDEEQAYNLFLKALQLDPHNADAMTYIAAIMMNHPENSPTSLHEAHMLLWNANQIQPGNLFTLKCLGILLQCNAYGVTRDLQSAYNALAEVIRQTPDDAEALTELGSLLYVARHEFLYVPQNPIVFLEKAIQLDPYNWKAHYYLGCAYSDDTCSPEEKQKALLHLQKAHELNPYDPLIVEDLITLCQEINGKSQKTASIDPNKQRQASKLRKKAEQLWKNHKEKEAIQTLKKALKIDPTNATIHWRLGRYLAKGGKVVKKNEKEAFRHFTKANTLKKTDLIISDV